MRFLAPLRHRDFRRFWVANLISLVGDGVTTVALALEALKVDPSPAGLALVLAARTVPSVFLSLVGGVVADRLPRRTTLLAADLVRGATVAVVGGLVATNLAGIPTLALMSIIFGTADAFAGPAFLAILPEIVPEERITSANALNSTSSQLSANLAGPALGGVLAAAVGVPGAFWFDAATFGASMVLVWGIGQRSRPAGERSSVLREALDGLRYIASRRWLLVLLVGASLANLTGLGPYSVLLPALVRHVLGAGPAVLGLVYAGSGLAGVLAAVIVGQSGEPRHLLEVMWTAYGASGLMVAALSRAPDALFAGLFAALAAGLVVYGDVLYFSRLQRSVPQEMLGRVSSASFLIVMTLTPAGTVGGGFLAAHLGVRTTLLLSGILSAACVLVILVPGARDIPGIPKRPPAAAATS